MSSLFCFPCHRMSTGYPESLYDLVGVASTCTDYDIRKTRRKCLYVLHSDKDKTTNSFELSEKRCIVEGACDILANATTRAKYDWLLKTDYAAVRLSVLGISRASICKILDMINTCTYTTRAVPPSKPASGARMSPNSQVTAAILAALAHIKKCKDTHDTRLKLNILRKIF